MVDICSYVLILASVVLFGYSLSRLIDGFSTVQKKMQDYRQMLAEYEAPPDATRRINTLQNGFLALGYVVLAHLAGFTLWFLALMAAKFTLSSCFSDKLHCLVIHRERTLSRRFYGLLKADALLNIFLSAFLLLVLVL